MRKTVSGALSVLKMFKTALHGEKVVHIYWHTSAFSLRLRLSHAMHAITSSSSFSQCSFWRFHLSAKCEPYFSCVWQWTVNSEHRVRGLRAPRSRRRLRRGTTDERLTPSKHRPLSSRRAGANCAMSSSVTVGTLWGHRRDTGRSRWGHNFTLSLLPPASSCVALPGLGQWAAFNNAINLHSWARTRTHTHSHAHAHAHIIVGLASC